MTLEEVLERYPGAQTFRFGDSAELCDRLLALVREGRKTATCGAVRDFEAGEPWPEVGRRDVALTWDGAPALVIETLSVERMAIRDVPEDFALAEGENDSRAGWLRDHQAYFERNGGFDPEMEVLCERFRLVADLGTPG